MEYEAVTVHTRDEYKAGQEPTAFEWRGRRFEVVQIADRWYEGHLDPTRMPLSYFKVRTGEGKEFILRYHEVFRSWAVRIPHEGP